MSTIKISELPVITGANAATTDVLPLVDVSLNTTNKITRAEFFKNVPDMEINDKIIHSGDTNTSIRFPAADTVTVETSGAERMRITSTGDVGIGTGSTISAIFHVNSGLQNLAGLFESTDAGASITLIDNSTTGGSVAAHGLNTVGNELEVRAVTTLAFETAATERMRIDANGNVGIGVTPSAWYTSFGTRAVQVGASASLVGVDVSASDRRTYLMNNSFLNSTGAHTYINSSAATQYQQVNGQHQWYNAGSGTAGNAITFTQAMTLTASGNLGVGTSSPDFKLDVQTASGQNYIRVSSATGQDGGFRIAEGTTNKWLLYNIAASDAFAIYDNTATAERLRIDASGNVGIGTSSPASLGSGVTTATISGASGGGIQFARTDATAVTGLISALSTGVVMGSISSSPVLFRTNNTERARIDSAGNLGIGNIAPITPLHVTGATVTTGVVYKNQSAQVVETAAATLTIAELLTGIIQYTGALATLTMPTGTAIEGGVPATFPVDMSFDFSVINTGSGVVTLGTAAGLTLTGGMTVAAAASGLFRVRKTALNTYTVYRIS